MSSLIIGARFRDATLHTGGVLPVPTGSAIGPLRLPVHITARFREEWTK